MSVEILLLSIMCGMTLIGYMIAVNAHGSTRLSISYLLATILLAGTVWAIVQYVNTNLSRQQQEQYRRLEAENSKAEERIKTQENSLMRGQKISVASTKVNKVISQGTGYASSMMNANLRDFSVELDVLMGRATAMKRKITALKNEYKSIQTEASYFSEGAKLIEDALKNLSEASNYYRTYFRAEDSVQEELRERLMRQKARAAYNEFSKASSKIHSN